MATPKKKYLFEIQRASGHVIASVVIKKALVKDVEIQRLPDGLSRLVYKGEVMATSTAYVDESEKLTLVVG